MPLRDLFSVDDLLRPALLISWAVPAARVRPLVPSCLALDTVSGAGGVELALLTVAVVLNVGMHPHLLPALHTTCAQANYRTYVRGRDGAPGVYFFANFVAGRAGWVIPWLLSANVHYAPARLRGYLPHTATPGATWNLQLTMHSPLGPTQLVVGGPCVPLTVPAYWPDPATAAHFLSQRLTGYLRDRRNRVWALPVHHLEMTPWPGTVQVITCAPWQHWGLLSAAETAQPFAVLLQPEVLFRAYVPRPVW